MRSRRRSTGSWSGRLAGLAVLAILLGVPAGAGPARAAGEWAVGDTLAIGSGGAQLLFAVSGVQAPYDPQNPAIRPDHGLFLNVAMAVRNEGSEALTLTLLDFDVRDEQGRVFRPSLFTRHALSGQLAPGESMTGNWMFDVPPGHSYRLHFRPFEWRTGEVPVDLGWH